MRTVVTHTPQSRTSRRGLGRVWAAAVVLAVAVGAGVGPAGSAETPTKVVLSTSAAKFSPGTANQGWWSDTRANRDSDDGYLVSEGPRGSTRAFFTFDLPRRRGTTVVAATLELTRHRSGSDAVERLGLYDVTTDAATLNGNVGPDAAVHADLGTGISYGSFQLRGDVGATVVERLELSDAAVAAINAQPNGYFSIGAALTSADGRGRLFAASSADGAQRLVLELAPATQPDPAPAPAPSPTPTVTDVDARYPEFLPATVTVHQGDTVRWTNPDTFAGHTVTSDTRAWRRGSLNPAPSPSFSVIFDEVGVFEYHCQVHPGMAGTVEVIP